MKGGRKGLMMDSYQEIVMHPRLGFCLIWVEEDIRG
jgi:hypothetical protein